MPFNVLVSSYLNKRHFSVMEEQIRGKYNISQVNTFSWVALSVKYKYKYSYTNTSTNTNTKTFLIENVKIQILLSGHLGWNAVYRICRSFDQKANPAPVKLSTLLFSTAL